MSTEMAECEVFDTRVTSLVEETCSCVIYTMTIVFFACSSLFCILRVCLVIVHVSGRGDDVVVVRLKGKTARSKLLAT